MEHAVILCTGDELRPEDLPKPILAERAPPPRRAAPPTLRQLREQWLAPLERRYFVELLGECSGNVRAAAERAGVDPVTMYRLLRKRGVALRREASATDPTQDPTQPLPSGPDDAPPDRPPDRRRRRSG
jgi:DNA-binding NtrC family response regulator